MKCTKHPKYKVIRQPRAACEACWRLWIEKKDAHAKARSAAGDLRDWHACNRLEGIEDDE